MEQKKYNIGLDIGTSSVGWAVTDKDNNIIKYKGKNLWGAELFDEGQTKETRRTSRCGKRRLRRRKERIKILQSLLQEDIEKEYPNFLPMLRETSLYKDEKQISETIDSRKYNLFSEIGMTDSDYYDKYKTIYHLRETLIKNDEKYDIRLVYLAIHHIIKYRGNFLYEGDMKDLSSAIEVDVENLLEYIQNKLLIEFKSDKEEFINILKNKNLTKGEKKDKLVKLFEYTSTEKSIITAIISAIIGYAFDLAKIFEIDIPETKIYFSKEIQNEDEIKEALQEDVSVYESMQKIYNWYVLQDILKGKEYISEAFIDKYEKYKEDLNVLKKVYKTYLKDEYNDMFKKQTENNYASYDRKSNNKKIKKCTLEDLYKRIKKDLEKIPDNKEKEDILQSIANEDFLVKLNTTDNAAIPNQLHCRELEKILENQSKYYPTIKENKNRIIELMKFRIPYYVGPLANGNSKFAWLERKSNEKILPWNLEEIVDIDKTAEAFIRRMTNKCTYLINEDVIPKQSLLYSKYCVLNELANIRVNDKKLTPRIKEQIVEKLFKKIKIVKAKDLNKMLIENQIYMQIDTITGLIDNEKFMSSMSSYIDMEKIFGKIDNENIEMIEKLIEWITIYEDKKILKRRIKNTYNLPEEQVKQLVKLKYTGWSRLSKELLDGLKSKDDGKTIIQKLETTKENFMQIINNEKYGFDKQIEEKTKLQKDRIEYSDIEEIPTSPANKKAIWQTIKIVRELTRVMKCKPENIYIEFARNEEKKKNIKDNRAKRLLNIYDNFSEEIKQLKDFNPNVYKELKGKQNEKDFNERLYLYFSQNGKCLYTGKPLNIDELNLYEVDHILPQSYIKDDSLSNKALVYKEQNQRKSGSLLLNEDIINKQEVWWKQLNKIGLMDNKKLFNLTRRKMFETDSERAKFISRQLVETRQITKYVTNLLVSEYKDSNIFTIRAELTHHFRDTFKVYKNRNVNNYHHAQDAYIISIIGNIIDTKMQYNDEYKYTEYIKSYLKKQETEEKNKEKRWIVMGMVSNNIDKDKVLKALNYKDCFITRKLEEKTGEFYDQTLYSPKDKKTQIRNPIKEGKDISKYGGYSGENKAYFSICTYTDNKGKEEAILLGIPIKTSYDIKNGKTTLVEYITNTLEKQEGEISNLKIIRPKILKYQEYIDENNEKMRLCSDVEIRPSKELILDNKMTELVYLINLNESKLTDSQKEKVEKNYLYMFDYLVEKMAKEYKSLEKSMKKIKANRETFMSLDSVSKKATINKIIDMIESRCVDLKCINASSAEGRMQRKKPFKIEQLMQMTFIDKSITGIYERRYKINGVENSCSK